MPVLSIVIPIYNAAKYVDRCLRSIVEQVSEVTYEIVLVDDGSNDGSSDICNKWHDGFPETITVIHQRNSGVSAARNVGIELAKGSYLMFIDADDYVPVGFWHLVDLAVKTNADFVLFDYLYECDGLTTVESPLIAPANIIDMQKLILQCNQNSPCSRLYRSELISNVRFPLGQSLGEDLIFNLRYLEIAKTFSYIHKPIYIYAANGESRMFKSPHESDALDYRSMYRELMAFCDHLSLGLPEMQTVKASMVRIISNYAARSNRKGIASDVVSSWLETAETKEIIDGFRPRSIKDAIRFLILRFHLYALAGLLLRG